MRRFILAIACLAMTIATAGQVQAGVILTSGNEINSTVDGYIAAMGHTVTHVSPNDFGTASFAGFDAIYLDWISNFNGLLSRKSDLDSFVAAGGNLFAEITQNSGNPITDYLFGEELGLGTGSGDNVRIVDSSHELMTGLTDSGLSNWGNSHHGHYVSDIGSFTGIADTGVSNQWSIITKQHGLGNVTYISLDPSYHIKNGAGPTGAFSQKGILINNALSLTSANATVPEPTSLAIFGIGALGLVASRRRRKLKVDLV